MRPEIIACLACTIAVPVIIISLIVSSLGRLQTHEVGNRRRQISFVLIDV